MTIAGHPCVLCLYQPKEGFTSTFSLCSSGQALGMQVWSNRSCTRTASAKDWKTVAFSEKQILLFVASTRCNRLDIYVNCLLRAGGDFKNIFVHIKCTFSRVVCVNVWNLSKCPVLVLFFLLQHSRFALQKVVVVPGVASLFSLPVSRCLMQQLQWCVSWLLLCHLSTKSGGDVPSVQEAGLKPRVWFSRGGSGVPSSPAVLNPCGIAAS